MKITKCINSKNVIAVIDEVKALRKQNPDFPGCYFEISRCGNSPDILIRMSSGARFYEPFLRVKFSVKNYKFRDLFLNL